MRAAWTGFKKPGWKAIMKRRVLVSRASADEITHGSSVLGNEGRRAP